LSKHDSPVLDLLKRESQTVCHGLIMVGNNLMAYVILNRQRITIGYQNVNAA